MPSTSEGAAQRSADAECRMRCGNRSLFAGAALRPRVVFCVTTALGWYFVLYRGLRALCADVKKRGGR
jgi:hypothetical protein